MLKSPTGQRKHVECPICKDKLFVEISQVPKSLVIMQVMDVTRKTTSSNTNSLKLTPNTYNQNMNVEYGMPNNSTASSSEFFSPPVIPPRAESKPTLKSTNPFYSDYKQSEAYSEAPPPQNVEP